MDNSVAEFMKYSIMIKNAAHEMKMAALELHKATSELTKTSSKINIQSLTSADKVEIKSASLEVKSATIDLKNATQELNNVSSELKNAAQEIKNSQKEQKSPVITPKTPQSLITEINLKEALKADKGPLAQLVSWRVQDFTSKGDNYACVVSSGVVKYTLDDKEDEVTYVAKLNPCRGLASFEEISTDLFDKEIFFYETLMIELNKQLITIKQPSLRIPKCYYTCNKVANQIIILEDLRARGFKMFDRLKGMDVAHTNLVLRELARLHAASVLLQQETSENLAVKYPVLGKDWDTYESEITKEQFKNMFAANMINGARMASKVEGYEKVVDWLKEKSLIVMDLFSEQLEKSPPFDVVNHGDCWNNNLLFRYNDKGSPVEVMLLDFQICRKASPALDLNYLMYTSLTGEGRKPNLKAFFSTYHQTFSEVLQASGQPMTFTEEELMVEFKKKSMFGLLMGVMAVPIILCEAHEVPDFGSIMEGEMENFLKTYQDQVMEMIDTNPLLRPRFLSIFDEMIEYGLIS